MHLYLFWLLPLIKATPITVGYIDSPLYDFQNSYFSQLVKTAASSGRVNFSDKLESASFEYDFLAFSGVEDLKNCVSTDKCQMALNYGQ